jgi:protein subunit release factor A
MEIPKEDIIVNTYRRDRNSYCLVYIIHKPTGISVESDTEKDIYANYKRAMVLLENEIARKSNV